MFRQFALILIIVSSVEFFFLTHTHTQIYVRVRKHARRVYKISGVDAYLPASSATDGAYIATPMYIICIQDTSFYHSRQFIVIFYSFKTTHKANQNI